MKLFFLALSLLASSAFAQKQAQPTKIYLDSLNQLAQQVARQGVGGNYQEAKASLEESLSDWERTDYQCCENESFVFEVLHKAYNSDNQLNLLVIQATPNFGGSVLSSTYSRGDERILLREHLTMKIEFAIKFNEVTKEFGGMGNLFTDTELSLKYQAADKSLLPFETVFRKKHERAVLEKELHQMTLEFAKDPFDMHDEDAIEFAKASLGL